MNIQDFLFEHPWIFFAVAINLLGFLCMGIDKLCAKAHLFRFPERFLMFLATLFGSAGVGLGMLLFHHKIRKPRFAWGVPILLILQCAVIYFAMTTNWNQVFA